MDRRSALLSQIKLENPVISTKRKILNWVVHTANFSIVSTVGATEDVDSALHKATISAYFEEM